MNIPMMHFPADDRLALSVGVAAEPAGKVRRIRCEAAPVSAIYRHGAGRTQ